MMAVSDFSGLTSSAWALAKAEAKAATDSLDRCMGGLCLEDVEAHRARSRALPSHPVSDRLLGVFGHQGFELAFCPLVLEECLPRVAKQGCKLGPGIRGAHVHAADRLYAGPRRLGVDQVRWLTRLYTAPEFLFGRDQNAEVKWVHGNRDLNPFPSAGDD